MKRLFSLLLCCALVLSIVPFSTSAALGNKVAWNMEKLPADLVNAGWAASDYENANIDGVVHTPSQNVKLRKAEGKGLGGSSALEIYQAKSGMWSDMFTLNMSADSSAITDWTEAKMLWFWVSNSTGSNLMLDLQINGKTPGMTYHYYSYTGGRPIDLGTLPAAWSGADYARLQIKQGFTGYIGLPLSAYGRIGRVSSLRIYVSDLAVGKSLYLDNFCITDRFVFNSINGGNVVNNSALLNAADSNNAYTITTDFTAEHQKVEALGASDCWWATGIGDTGTATAVIKLLYSDLGIALNNYRINVGGGVKNDKSDTVVYGWRAPASPLGEDGTMDITRNDRSYQALMQVAQLGTVDDYTLFMNTPPSTMKDNGLTYQGALKADSYAAYGQYVADVVKLYQNAGIDVKYVSPVNEPADYWSTNTTQECTVYSMSQIVDVYVEVIKALKANNLNVKVSLGDFNNWSVAKNNLTKVLDGVLKNSQISSYARDYVDHISAHSYNATTDTRRAMVNALNAYNAANGTNIVLHQSEWGPSVDSIADNMDTATELAYTLHEDLTILDVPVWSWWLGASFYNYTDGLIYTSEDGRDIQVTKRMWAFGNYSKFIKGMTRVETGGTLPNGVYVSAYKDTAAGKLVYVLINRNAEGKTVKMSGLPKVHAQVWETSDSYNCQQIGMMDMQKAYTLPAMSVTTLVVEGESDYGNRPGMVVWGMDALPDNLVSAGWAVPEFGNVADYNPENVTVTKSAGKGFEGGDAVAITQVNAGNWADLYRLRPAENDSLYFSNWNGAQVLWFWTDATNVKNDITVELVLDSTTPMVGYDCYTLDKSNAIVRADKLVKAYDGDISYGVIPVRAGFCGWMGVPLAAFAGVQKADTMRLYLRGAQPGDVLYLDEFCVSKADEVPALPAENTAPFENAVLAMGANDGVGQRYAYYNDSQNRQAWVFGIEGNGGGAILWESFSYSSVQWLTVPAADLTGSDKLCFYLDNQSGYSIDKLGVGLRDVHGNTHQPGQSSIATKNGYDQDYSAIGWGYLEDGSTGWVTGKLDSWGWMRGIPANFKGWIYVNLTGYDSYETVYASAHQTTQFDYSHVTGICVKAGEDKQYRAVFDSFYGCNTIPVLREWNLSLGEDIGANFYVDLKGTAPQTAVMEMTVAGKTTSVTAAQADRSENGDYIFRANVAATQMTEPIGLRLKVNGKLVHEDSYTVRQYADTILNGNYTDGEKGLVKAMLNYGGKAQTYFGYNTDDLADADITVKETDVPTDVEAMSVSGKIDGLRYYGATLVFESKTAARFYFTGDVSGCTFKVGEDTLTPVQKDDMWYVEIADIAPQDLDKAITLSVNDTLSVTYSPLNYMVRMNANGSDTLKALLKAMYTYHLAAVEYTK